MKRHQNGLPNRRSVLAGIGFSLFLASSTALTQPILAQDTESFAFDFDSFSERMKTLAAGAYEPSSPALPAAFQDLGYDDYRLIQYRPNASKWLDDPANYRIQAFHPGWLFRESVQVFEVEDGNASLFHFTPDDFQYHDEKIAAAAGHDDFPGVAGFRVNYPLNRPGAFDELISYLGASYFRALGRDNVYGTSARGLVLNSWVDIPEEFPRFSEFYVEKPEEGGPLTVYAALESASVTGAYRFIIHPANPDQQETAMDVTARLYFRTDIKELGIGPLTSMFLYAENNRSGFDDYRPQVHDCNGLLIERESGEIMWRALNNSPVLGNSYFWENNPRAFGLYQRGRDFATYQDAGAHYERRPSVRVEPQGQWGQGMVRLIEIPASLEADDNIGAFWVPTEPALAGEAREYAYRLIWGNLNPEDNQNIAYVVETRGGVGGVSGVENAANLRKFVVDFAGGQLDTISPETPVDVLANVSSGGLVRSSVLSKIEANGHWRLVLDIETEGTNPIEIKAYLVGLGKQLTETWLYQWRPEA